jgi:KDO2-lipid IV(A) lauroyltransferase
MYINDFYNTKKKIYSNYLNALELDGKQRLEYLQCISSRQIFLEEYNRQDDYSFYTKIKTTEYLSNYDFNNFHEIKEHLNLIGNFKEAFSLPKIYCSFHFGSYKILNCILHDMNVDFAVVMGKTAIESSANNIIRIHEKELETTKRNVDFDIIDANSNSGLVKLIRALRGGKSLVIYIDGGKGIQNLNVNIERVSVINFLDEYIYSRTGVAYLSSHLNVPIVPVISNWESDYSKINIHFYDELIPKSKKTKDLHNVTAKIWEIFSPIVKKYPEQWEAILFSHLFLIKDKKELSHANYSMKQYYSFNNNCFDFFIKSGEYFLYSIENFTTYKLKASTYKLLKYLKVNNNNFTQQQLCEIAHQNLIDDLIKNKVLI